MKKNRLLFIVIVSVLVIISVACIFVQMSRPAGKYVVVEEDGVETMRFLLADTVKKEIHSRKGVNTLVIAEGKASIVEADCPGQDCVHFQAIDQLGESIVCLPHRLVIEVVEE